MKNLITLLSIFMCLSLQAQEYVEGIGFRTETISHLDIGWMKEVKYTQPAKPLQLHGRSYSAKQVRYCEQFIEWMQQSYLPKGVLGELRYYVNDKTGTTYIDQLKNGLPQMYGSYAKLYRFLKKDANGKFVPQNNLSDFWRIEANQLEYISQPIQLISTPTQYFFTMPYYSENIKRDWSSHEQASKWMGFDTHPNLNNYMHFFQPKDATEYGIHQFVVIMTKDGKLPFETITIGEFFTLAEKQLPVWQKAENPSRPYSNEDLTKAKKSIAYLREKYKSKLNDVAKLNDRTTIDFSTFLYDFSSSRDMFDNNERTSFPIYKISETTKAACKTDQPQWLVVRWDGGYTKESAAAHLHESVMNNFNFDYLYNAAFYPEKIKGKNYEPLRSPSAKIEVVKSEASTATKKAATDKNSFFFDDFSTTAINNAPLNWRSSLNNDGRKASIVKIDGNNSNWLELKNHVVSSIEIKNALPQNFELSFDVAVPKDFTWGGYRMYFFLGSNGKKDENVPFIKLGLKPGFSGKAGFGDIRENVSKPTLTTKDFELPKFSNNLNLNNVTIKIINTDKSVSVYVDTTLVHESLKTKSSNNAFNYLEFTGGENNGDEKRKYFISNVKIINLN